MEHNKTDTSKKLNMEAKTTFTVKTNDDNTPGHNDYINNEYELREEAKQILTSQLISLAMRFCHDKKIQPFEEFLRYQSFKILRKPKPDTMYYVKRDAKDILSDYIDEIAEMLIDDGKASTDLYNDYDGMDSRISESDDYWRRPDEAIEVIDELSEFEEEDRGLWEGSSDYSDILNAIAHYTYTNALYAEIESMIESINDAIDSDTITEIEEKITKGLLTEDDYQSMKESEIDIDNFDEVREWCEENSEEFTSERMNKIKEAIKEELD